MKNLSSSIIIAGPTTTGKSEISAMLARRINGAIINTDNYYFYANQYFHIGLGLSRDEPPIDIPCYLFGIREISKRKPNPIDSYKLVVSSAEEALKLGYTPIIQGCSFTLNELLIRSSFTDNIFIPLWSAKDDLAERCNQRIHQMLDEGLLEEARRIIELGNDNSWIAREGIIYGPTIEYIKSGLKDENKLIRTISAGIIGKAEEQELKYRGLPNINLVHHANNPGEALEIIMDNLY